MQFLKTLFWVALAVLLVVFSIFNWSIVHVNLWGGLIADVKLPMLVFAAFLLGFAPTMIYHLTRMWRMRRRIEGYERQVASTIAPSLTVEPAAPIVHDGDRVATDSMVWPTS